MGDGKIRYSVFAYDKSSWETTRPKGSDLKLIFNTHTDVVPPWFPSDIKNASKYLPILSCSVEEFKQTLICTETEILTGRGACDTKSLSAPMLLAALDPALQKFRKQIGFLFVVPEETTHQGMIKANELNLNPEFLIVGEPTARKIIRFQKGILKVKLHCKGRACHSGYPHLGTSANGMLVELLNRIQHEQWPEKDYVGETD